MMRPQEAHREVEERAHAIGIEEHIFVARILEMTLLSGRSTGLSVLFDSELRVFGVRWPLPSTELPPPDIRHLSLKLE